MWNVTVYVVKSNVKNRPVYSETESAGYYNVLPCFPSILSIYQLNLIRFLVFPVTKKMKTRFISDVIIFPISKTASVISRSLPAGKSTKPPRNISERRCFLEWWRGVQGLRKGISKLPRNYQWYYDNSQGTVELPPQFPNTKIMH